MELKSNPEGHMASSSISSAHLRKESRASIGDRDKLGEVHAVLIETINESHGEERQMLSKLRQEVKDVLNSRVLICGRYA